MSSRVYSSRRRRQPGASGIVPSDRLDREEALDLADSAVKIETIRDLEASVDSTDLDAIAVELDSMVQQAGVQSDDWCDLNESDIIKANLRVKQTFGDAVGSKYFALHCDLFQKASDMIKKVSQSQVSGAEPFYESTKTFCYALLTYNQVLQSASDESEIAEGLSNLQLVFDEDLFVSYSVLSINLEGAAASTGFVSGAFGVIKWALRYYTILYVTGMFLYNLHNYSELFNGTNAVLDVCMKLFGCLCLAFIGSTYLAGKVIQLSLSLLNGIVRSLIPSSDKMSGDDSAISGGFRYLGTAFLSGWLVSVARMVCLITTEAASLGFRGFAGVVWDGINNIGWKSWNTIAEVTVWIKGFIAENSMGLAQWFITFMRDVVWKRLIDAVYGMVSDGSAAPTATLGLLSNVQLTSVSELAVNETMVSQFKSGIVRSLAVLQNTLEDNSTSAAVETFSVSMTARLTQPQVIEELKLVPFAANATNAVNIMSYDDMIANINALTDIPRKPQISKVKYLITEKYTSLLKIALLAFVFLATYYKLLRGV